MQKQQVIRNNAVLKYGSYLRRAIQKANIHNDNVADNALTPQNDCSMPITLNVSVDWL